MTAQACTARSACGGDESAGAVRTRRDGANDESHAGVRPSSRSFVAPADRRGGLSDATATMPIPARELWWRANKGEGGSLGVAAAFLVGGPGRYERRVCRLRIAGRGVRRAGWWLGRSAEPTRNHAPYSTYVVATQLRDNAVQLRAGIPRFGVVGLQS